MTVADFVCVMRGARVPPDPRDGLLHKADDRAAVLAERVAAQILDQVPEPADGPGPGVGVVPALRALRVAVYEAFLAPDAVNSSGFSPVRQESLSRMPHTVMPVHRVTARQALTTVA